MTKRQHLSSGVGLASLLWSLACAPAFAEAGAAEAGAGADQQANEAAAGRTAAEEAQQNASEEIVVSGSRIQVSGFQQPTPVTVLGEADIKRSLANNISDVVNQLPSFGRRTSVSAAGNGYLGGGLSLLNLRDLGSQRTLVLLDSRRVVNSTLDTGVDVNTLPSTLVERVEVVTGGASAAWGADAVAGVVNFVLNKRYKGMEIALQGGFSEGWRSPNGKVDVTFGSDLFGGRGHIVMSGTYSTSPRIVRNGQLKRFKDKYYALVNNPAYTAGGSEPRMITVPNSAPAAISSGGLIVSGPLRGIQFVGPNGTPVPYDFGYTSTGLQVGGDLALMSPNNRTLTNSLDYSNIFSHMTYDLTDNITFYLEGSYATSKVTGDTTFYNRQSNITVRRDNAFLDPAIRQQMIDNNITSMSMSKTFIEGGNIGNTNRRKLWQGVAGLDGKLGEWEWNAYYSHGEARFRSRSFGMPFVARLNLAMDAVVNPANGAIVCRSTLTDPTNGCAAFNIFGEGVVSDAALDYVYGTKAWQHITIKQDFASLQFSGPVFALPAGDVTAAIGADTSREKAISTQDANSLARAFAYGNPQPFDGKVSFKEVFGEVNIPLLKDTPMFQQLTLNAAGRMTDYSTSGTVYTWKVGLSNEINDQLRVRVTRSRDIRAPSLNDLFSQGVQTTQNGYDPVTNANFTAPIIRQGNPDLKPEVADTFTSGIVYRPDWMSGLGISLDYYNIRVKGAIAGLTANQTLNLCFGGNTEICKFVTRDANNIITRILTLPTNINVLKTEGFDLEVNYRRPAFNGMLTLRTLGSYQPKFDFTAVDGGVQHVAGTLNDATLGQPKLKGQFSASYDADALSLTAQMRFIGRARLVDGWVEGVDVDRNRISAAAYLDLRASYILDIAGAKIQASMALDNALGKSPVVVPAQPRTVYANGSHTQTRSDLYDFLGRTFRFGLSAKF